MSKTTRIAFLAAALAAVFAAPTVASAQDGTADQGAVAAVASADVEATAAGCARELDKAIQQDMVSFGNYDAEAWAAVHHEDAISIFVGGIVVQGRDAIVRALRNHFEGREATWNYTELKRVVDGCHTAFILFDTTYGIPSTGFSQRAIVGVTYARYQGQWLVIADQNTLKP